MVRIHKRASKRVGTKQREKIKKKVSEHHRKSKRLAKKDVTWKSKAKKDPGIPNSYPYKEQLLEEIETKRRLAEEVKLAEKEARAEKKRRRASGEDEQEEEEEEEADELSQEVEDLSDSLAAPLKATASLYRGAVQSLLSDKTISVILIAFDARDPQTWAVPWAAEAAMRAGKSVMFVLGRADLIPLEALTTATALLLQQWPKVPVYPVGVVPAAAAGIDALAAAVQPHLQADTHKVAVIGLENAGRTAIASALAVHLNSSSSVLDTPALVDASSSSAVVALSDLETDAATDLEEEELQTNALAPLREQRLERESMWLLMRNQGSLQRIKDPIPLVYALFARIDSPTDLMLGYNTPAFGAFTHKASSLATTTPTLADHEQAQRHRVESHKNADDFLIALARGRGRVKKRGVPDAAGAARLLLRDWSLDQIGYYCSPAIAADDSNLAVLRSSALDQIAASPSLSALVRPRKEWRKVSVAGKKELRLSPLEWHPLGLNRSTPLQFKKLRGEDLLAEGEVDLDDSEADEEAEDDEDIENSHSHIDDADDETQSSFEDVTAANGNVTIPKVSKGLPLQSILKRKVPASKSGSHTKTRTPVVGKKARISHTGDDVLKTSKAKAAKTDASTPAPGDSYSFSQFF